MCHPPRLLLLFIPLLSIGCGRSPVNPAPSADFVQEYEAWKARAVREFPDLGKAGTPLNTRFVARAKQLTEQNANELKYPNWPYLLAVKVNAELTATAKGPADKGSSAAPVEAVGKVPAIADSKPLSAIPGAGAGGGLVTNLLAGKPNPEPAATPKAAADKGSPAAQVRDVGKAYTTPELKALSVLPSAALVDGRVTKIDDIGMPPGVLLVVLDDVLKCELTMVEVGPTDAVSWQRSGSSISLMRQIGRGPNSRLVSLSMGQALRVEGAFVQRRGMPVLVGTPKYFW